eukprot:3841990-Ditylum_brightwellii.AAC.1
MQVPVFMQMLQDHFIKFHNLTVVHGKTPLVLKLYMYFRALGKRGSVGTTMAVFLEAAKASNKKEKSNEL